MPKLFSTHVLFEEPRKKLAEHFDVEYWTGEERPPRAEVLNRVSGKDAGAVYMPAPQTGSPMTYMLNGQQYIVIAVSGPNYPGELIAYRLPPN